MDLKSKIPTIIGTVPDTIRNIVRTNLIEFKLRLRSAKEGLGKQEKEALINKLHSEEFMAFMNHTDGKKVESCLMSVSAIRNHQKKGLIGVGGKITKSLDFYSFYFPENVQQWYKWLEEYKNSKQTPSVKITDTRKKIHQQNTFDFSLFNYVATLDRFNLYLPVSLIEKLVPEEWEIQKLSIIQNKEENKIHSYFNQDVSYLQLSEKGVAVANSMEFHDVLIFKILDLCDFTIKIEENLFKKIALKKYFFFVLFKDFSIDFNNLIHSKNYPSIPKQTLLYRLMGFYYTELGDYQKMHESFKKCIGLLQKENTEESSSFYLNWAECEIKFGKEEKAIEIYYLALEDLPFPKNKNRTIRLTLSTYYFENNDIEKAFSFWSLDDFYLLKDDRFVDRFYEFLIKLINKDPKKATICQEFVLKLINEYSNKGYTVFSKNLLEEIDEKVTNNFKFKKALFYYYLQEDKPKALELIKGLESNEKINQEIVVGLRMDYFLADKNPDLAIWHGTNSLTLNTYQYPSVIYRKIGKIYFKNKRDLKNAKRYFEKLEEAELYSYYQYAVTLFKISPDEYEEEIFLIFQNHFKKFPATTNVKAIGTFVTFCLKYNKRKFAIALIFKKIQEIHSNENYNNYFISFLYQQQLRLTVNHEQSKNSLKDALTYSENQEAIIYSGYAKHLMYRDLDNKINSSFYDLYEAIEYFRISNNRKADDLILLDMAKCYFKVEEYNACIEELNKIRKRDLSVEKNSLKIKALFYLRNFREIENIINEIRVNHLKGLGFFYLAQNWRFSDEKRKAYFEEAIHLNFNTDIKFEFAIFFYKKSEKKQSKDLINEIKLTLNTEDEKITLQSEYYKRISSFIPKAYPVTIKKINNNIKTLTSANPKVLYGIDTLIKKYPLDTQINKLKFDYFFKIGKFHNCDRVLENLIKNNLINPKTSNLFLQLSKNHFDYSQYYNPKKTINRKNQVDALVKAFKYMEYVLKIDPSIENQALYSIIPFKQGNFNKHTKIYKSLLKKLNREDIEIFKQKINLLKKEIKIFLWETREDEYENQLLFYRNQEKLAANIIRTSDKKFSPKPIKILKSILLDTEFHKENNYQLYNNIITRLGHYYYHYHKNYKTALYYKKQVYKTQSDNIPFIRAFLKTTHEVIHKKYQYEKALEICNFYLESVEIPTIYRYQGNFLKELGRYKEAYQSYFKALKMFNKPHYTIMIHNNIIILCHRSLILNKEPFDSVKNIKEIANNSFTQIMSLNSDYKYRDETFKKLEQINAYV